MTEAHADEKKKLLENFAAEANGVLVIVPTFLESTRLRTHSCLHPLVLQPRIHSFLVFDTAGIVDISFTFKYVSRNKFESVSTNATGPTRS